MTAVVLACSHADARPGTVEIRFWALGAEGEHVQPLVRDFERTHPGVRVRVQQIPFGAAHEKLLTAVVGDATPDVAQLGNTWVPELATLGALDAIDARLARSTAIARPDYFPGVWAMNVVDGKTYGVPWYVDTRLLFYRSDLYARVGVPAAPRSWAEWVEAMRRVRAVQPPGGAPALLPLNEFEMPVIVMLQSGAPLLKDDGTRGNFRDPRVRAAFEFYVSLFKQGLAPTLANTQISNVYQELGSGRFTMFITGPWNLSEMRKRLGDSMSGAWTTAPMPGPDGAASGTSIPGGSSLVLFRGRGHGDVRRRDAAWQLVEYLSAPAQQLGFYEATGDLPARETPWRDPRLAGDPKTAAFLTQLRRLTPVPRVPEWELIASRVAQAVERAARGVATTDEALATLDDEVDEILEKRRYLIARAAARPVAGGDTALHRGRRR
ncbi:MAG: sugar ABC transporter substrate-binding protein [Gemmatirosa sp.]|nr:sugar ABC transporter substrate-binding protein [Gemmatirosa sp.]